MAPVEAEDLFVEVGLQVLGADGAMNGATNPALHQAEHPMHGGEHFVGLQPRRRHRRAVVLLQAPGRRWVGRPAVGDDRAAGLDGVGRERRQAARRGVRDDGEAGTAEADVLEFDCASEQDLARRTGAGYSRLGSSQEGLVDLDVTAKPVSTGTAITER